MSTAGRRASHPKTSHAEVAARAKAAAGQWVRGGTYRTHYVAQNLVRYVRGGKRIPYYAPPGAFDARTALEGDETALWVRYVGPVAEAVTTP